MPLRRPGRRAQIRNRATRSRLDGSSPTRRRSPSRRSATPTWWRRAATLATEVAERAGTTCSRSRRSSAVRTQRSRTSCCRAGSGAEPAARDRRADPASEDQLVRAERCSSSSRSGARRSRSARRNWRRSKRGWRKSSSRRRARRSTKRSEPRAARQRGQGGGRGRPPDQRAQQSGPRSRHAAPWRGGDAARVRSISCRRASPRPTSASSPSTPAGSFSKRWRPRRTSSSTCWTTCASTSRRWASRRRSSITWPQKAAQLEFMLQEARSTLGKLQHERELAERLEQGIRQLSLKSAKPEEELGRRTEGVVR